MSIALDQGILKCISTDTLRSVMRSFIDPDKSPALHRSSYAPALEDGSDDPVTSWMQTCTVLQHSVEDLVHEMIDRGVSLVVEGAHLVPHNALIQKWNESGGVAVGIMLQVSDEEAHKSLLVRRGVTTGKGEEEKLRKFQRVRVIQDEMSRLAKEADWLIVEQNLQPDPFEIVASRLWSGEAMQDNFRSAEQQLTSRSERQSGSLWEAEGRNPMVSTKHKTR
jgi:2-phosphoglycerate kinase